MNKFRSIKSLTTLVTTAALLIHASLGCCAHHVHAATTCNRECQHASVGETESAKSSECGHAHSRNFGDAAPAECGNRSDEPENHRHVPCDDVSCKWLGNLSVVRLFSADHHVLLAIVPDDLSSQKGTRWNSPGILAQTESRFIETARALNQVWRL